MTAFTELYIDQGSTFINTLNLTDDITNQPINVSSYVVTGQLRRSYYSANASANLTCTITNSETGEITLSLSAEQTANLKAGRYLFDVKSINQGNNVTRILEGIINITPQVTR
jgi:hypothetical protein